MYRQVHLFDGYGMIVKFTIADGKVSVANRCALFAEVRYRLPLPGPSAVTKTGGLALQVRGDRILEGVPRHGQAALRRVWHPAPVAGKVKSANMTFVDHDEILNR